MNKKDTYCPTSVYRLQFNQHFTFNDAIEHVNYLKNLGIDAVYCSPYLKTKPGSLHGYDIISPLELNAELGCPGDYEGFCSALKEAGMGHIFDLVANHMAASEYNSWWFDVLENGPKSIYTDYFDIDWDPPVEDLKGRILAPVLLHPLEDAIQQGEVKLGYAFGRFEIQANYQAHPINPATYSMILGDAIACSKAELKGLMDRPEIRKQVEARLALFNADPKRLTKLLDLQYFKLEFWQMGPLQINYRRFFDINELAALKVENEKVFEHYHRFVFQLIREGKIQGLRIDHPDGFYEPETYFNRLPSIYVVVEKILGGDEELPSTWKVDGTVGYEYLNDLLGIFIKQDAESAFDQIYEEFIQEKWDRLELLYKQKREFALNNMLSEVNALSKKLHSCFQDFDFEDLKRGLVELFALFPVYRTYISYADTKLSKKDQKILEETFKELKKTAIQKEVIALLERIFTLKESACRDIVLRFQQLSPPIMAKGLEDTHFYVYNRFIALNEVGGSPGRFGISTSDFHKRNVHRREHWPHGFLPSSTHDTKRSEDVRMRLAVLSEMPEEWKTHVEQWSLISRDYKMCIEPNFEYFIYQTLVGFWSDDPNQEQRAIEYFVKAAAEAKVHTNWIQRDLSYEAAVESFVHQLMNSKEFLESFLPFQSRVSELGKKNSYAAFLLRLGSPGVFDLYQGTERWNYSLVDPDNRRPVDYQAKEDEKFSLYFKGLNYRKSCPELFLKGDYIPLKVEGPGREHIIAFMRSYKEMKAIFVAARWLHTHPSFKETKITMPGNKVWTNLFTDEAFSINKMNRLNIALLT